MDTSRVILMDYDGVIADSLPVCFAVYRACADRWKLPCADSLSSYLSLFEVNIYEGLRSRGFPSDKIPALMADFTKAFTRAHTSISFFPLMEKTVRSLSERFPLYIVSSTSVSIIKERLAHHRILSVRDILGAERGASKVEKIRSILPFHPQSRFIFIGDTVGDIVEGREAGVKTMGVTWGFHSQEKLRAAKPDFLVESPDELAEQCMSF